MRLATSCAGRVQLSAEKAYSVSTFSDVRAAASTIRRTVRAPARCPADLASPRRSAQRPFPSMMIATCIALSSFCRVNQRFHVLQVTREHALPLRREAVLGLRHACREFLPARDIAGILELACMGA